MSKDNIGDLAWIDLSVENAEQTKNFYQSVVGWKTEEVPMGDYADYVMSSEVTGEAISGICHAKGINKDLPATWLPYFLVADIEASCSQALDNGGEQLTKIKSMGKDKYAVIKDPAGAICAIYQKFES